MDTMGSEKKGTVQSVRESEKTALRKDSRKLLVTIYFPTHRLYKKYQFDPSLLLSEVKNTIARNRGLPPLSTKHCLHKLRSPSSSLFLLSMANGSC